MRASEGVNWHLGWSSRNAETVKNDKGASEAYFLLDFCKTFHQGKVLQAFTQISLKCLLDICRSSFCIKAKTNINNQSLLKSFNP